MSIRDLKDKAQQLLAEQRALNDKILKEKREYTAEETGQWEKLDGEFNEVKGKIEETQKADEERARKAAALTDAERYLGDVKETQPQMPEPKNHPDKKEEKRVLPFFRTGRTLSKLPLEKRTAFLQRLHSSPLMPLRRGLWGIRTLIFMGYYNQDSVREEIGYGADPWGWTAHFGAPAAPTV